MTVLLVWRNSSKHHTSTLSLPGVTPAHRAREKLRAQLGVVQNQTKKTQE